MLWCSNCSWYPTHILFTHWYTHPPAVVGVNRLTVPSFSRRLPSAKRGLCLKIPRRFQAPAPYPARSTLTSMPDGAGYYNQDPSPSWDGSAMPVMFQVSLWNQAEDRLQLNYIFAYLLPLFQLSYFITDFTFEHSLDQSSLSQESLSQVQLLGNLIPDSCLVNIKRSYFLFYFLSWSLRQLI